MAQSAVTRVGGGLPQHLSIVADGLAPASNIDIATVRTVPFWEATVKQCAMVLCCNSRCQQECLSQR
jgi:hypothetical protein